MLLEVLKENYVNKRGQNHTRNVYVYECDQCSKKFERRHKYNGEPRLHFCSNECVKDARKKGGALCNKQEKTTLKRFGSIRPMQNKQVSNKREKTCIERYGVSNPMQDEFIKTKNIVKMRQTFLQRYGTMHPLQVKSIAKKAHDKAWKTFQKFGANSPASMPGADEKRKETCVERYGFSNPMQNKEIRKKAQKTREKNEKGGKTRSLYKKNKIETQIHTALNELFGEHEVFCQKWIFGHPVDFYVKSINTWLEHDGEYWHGLAEHIHDEPWAKERREKDSKQNQLFAEHSLKLVRIFYKEVHKLQHEELKTFLKQKLLNVE